MEHDTQGRHKMEEAKAEERGQRRAEQGLLKLAREKRDDGCARQKSGREDVD